MVVLIWIVNRDRGLSLRRRRWKAAPRMRRNASVDPEPNGECLLLHSLNGLICHVLTPRTSRIEVICRVLYSESEHRWNICKFVVPVYWRKIGLKSGTKKNQYTCQIKVLELHYQHTAAFDFDKNGCSFWYSPVNISSRKGYHPTLGHYEKLWVFSSGFTLKPM